jgi:hypothetical protein
MKTMTQTTPTLTRSSRIFAALILAFVCSLAITMPGIQAAADDVSGDWSFVMDTPGGTRDAVATFKVDGKNVTGTWGDRKTAVKGTFADNTLDLSFPIESENGPGTLGIKAKLANNELTGSWTVQEYNGSLKGTRAAK